MEVVGEPRILVRRDAHLLALRHQLAVTDHVERERVGGEKERVIGVDELRVLVGPPSYWARIASVTFSTSFSRITGAASTSVQTLKKSGAWSRPVLHREPYPMFFVAIEMPAPCSCRPRG